MSLKKILFPFVIGAFVVILAACGGENKEQGESSASDEEMQKKLAEQQVENAEVVAIINDEEVTGEAYNSTLSIIQAEVQKMGQDPTSEEAAEFIKAQVLETITNQTLLVQQIEASDIEVATSEIDEEYDSFEKQFDSEEELQETLMSQGMDSAMLKERIAETIQMKKYLEQVAPVEEATDQEVEDYYKQVEAEAKESGQEIPLLEDAWEDVKEIIKQERQEEMLIAHVEELKKDAEIETKI